MEIIYCYERATKRMFVLIFKEYSNKSHRKENNTTSTCLLLVRVKATIDLWISIWFYNDFEVFLPQSIRLDFF